MLGSCFVICLFGCYVFGCLASTFNVLTWHVMPVLEVVPKLFAWSIVLGRNLASLVSCGAEPELLCCQTKTSAAFLIDFRCHLMAVGLCQMIVFMNDVSLCTCIWWILLYLECCIMDLSCVRCYPGLTCEGPLLHADRGATQMKLLGLISIGRNGSGVSGP